MEDEFEMISKIDVIYTPILCNFIKKYGLQNVLSNKKIINNYKFYILFISMQNYNLYSNIGRDYKLFILNFIKYIQDINVKNFIGEIINIDNTDMYKSLSDYPILYLWRYTYNIEPSNISDYENITSNLDIKYILNKDKNHVIHAYDPDSIVKLLLFTWYSKYDLGVYILYKDSDDDIDTQEILNFIDIEHSIYYYVNQSDKNFPFFDSSQNTIDAYRNLPIEMISLDIDPGYVWKNIDSINKLSPIGIAENLHDKFFSLLYNCLINGIITNNIVTWTYLFGYNIIDPILLNKLFSISMNIPIQLSGIISDLYDNKNFKAIEMIKDNIKESNVSYNYFQGQKDIYVQDALANMPNNILNVIAEKNFEPKGYFTNFDIDINKINFNKNFFNVLLRTNPLSVKMEELKNKINNTYNDSYTTYYTNIYNTVNYIMSNNNNFEVIIDYKFTILSEINECNLKYFNLPIIKKEILNILFTKFYFIPDCENVDLQSQYNNFIIKKSNLVNIYNCLIHKDVENIILDKINKNIYLNTLFNY
ncbi:virion protein (Cop-E6R) [Adoxophyes honmai entomopoxvirus 'L']|uniref:Virion protein (Cop-E6R) n=1 Tax=Adoxophyes honmai entomopoxvirus 'L' TaxID=1293540 RepID=A0A916P0Z0_9POXV|nr:virion protein (Cop-E6R) [Adoxophyes honmai entomopoxvirus 'L']CCU55484.1 virion protein (Cop-E6R) [Adoxophyes honmai entomopoxvirus 'L']